MVQIILQIALLILFAKIFGELAEKIKLPSLLGEVFAGILLGPAILNYIHVGEVFHVFSEIGIILLLFIAGFEHGSIRELLRYKRTSILISVLSSTLPIIAVVLITQAQGYSLITSLFLAVALGATSMGVSLRSMMGVKEVDTKVGKTVIGSLVLNDITGLILLTGVVSYAEITTGGSVNIFFEILKIVGSIVFCFIIFYGGLKLIPKMTHSFIKLRVEEAQFSLSLIIILLSAWVAANFGLSAIIGAFVAGIILGKSPVFETHTFKQKISSISYGFFIPLFFALTGAQLSLNNFGAAFSQALIFLGIITSVQVGCAFIAAILNKYKAREALLIGFGMLPYGEVSLVVMATLVSFVAMKPEFFGSENIEVLFSSVLLLIIMTVILTPIAMKLINKFFKHDENST